MLYISSRVVHKSSNKRIKFVLRGFCEFLFEYCFFVMVVFTWIQLASHLGVSVRRLSTYCGGAFKRLTVKRSQYNE